MSSLIAGLREGGRQALAVLLVLAVLSAGLGLPALPHCHEHEGGHAVSALPDPAGTEDGHPDDDLCVNCDCQGLVFHWDRPCGVLPAAPRPSSLVQVEGALPPEGVVIDLEPPPDRRS